MRAAITPAQLSKHVKKSKTSNLKDVFLRLMSLNIKFVGVSQFGLQLSFKGIVSLSRSFA
jgi:hypothetical protein